jgi:hypothetical protein
LSFDFDRVTLAAESRSGVEPIARVQVEMVGAVEVVKLSGSGSYWKAESIGIVNDQRQGVKESKPGVVTHACNPSTQES